MKDPQTPLFHPFEVDILPVPGAGSRVLFLGARAGMVLPEGFSRDIRAVQGFRSDYLALKRTGLAVDPVAQGDAYDVALVLCGRQRQENEARIAEALERTRPGGLIVAAGSKDDGVASLRRRIEELIPLDGHLPKHHGVVFWLRRADEVEAAVRALRPRATDRVEGRFVTAPGMFSHDRVDEGSRLLAETLPDGISGRVADFCAGWGYLAWEVAIRCPDVRSIDLYEADFASLEAAKVNLAAAGAPDEVRAPDGVPSRRLPLRFFWHDLAGEKVTERYDAIVMNPPFHTGRRAEPELGVRLIGAAASALKPGGRLLMVANRQLPYEATLAKSFAAFSEVGGNGRFKVISARR